MQIQGRLHFSRSDVTCVPVDPALLGYTDKISFEDETLDFRIRLFGARVRNGRPAACVSLVLPSDLVLCREDPAFGVPEGQVEQFCEDADLDLHFVTAGPVDRPYRIIVERIVIDEVIAFAHSFGLYPVAVVIPTAHPQESVTLPIENNHTHFVGASAAQPPDRIYGTITKMPDVVRNELLKRQNQKHRQSSRVWRSVSISALIPGRAVLSRTKALASVSGVATAVVNISASFARRINASIVSAPESVAQAFGKARAPTPAARGTEPCAAAKLETILTETVAVMQTSGLIPLAQKDNAGQSGTKPDPVTPTPAGAFTWTTIGCADWTAALQRAQTRMTPLRGRLAAQMQAINTHLMAILARLGRHPHRRVPPKVCTLPDFDLRRVTRPAPLAALSVFGIVSVLVHMQSDHVDQPGAVPVYLWGMTPESNVSVPIPQFGPLASATETLDVAAGLVPTSPLQTTTAIAPLSSTEVAPLRGNQSAATLHGRPPVVHDPLHTTLRRPDRPVAVYITTSLGWVDPSPMRTNITFPAMPSLEAQAGVTDAAEMPAQATASTPPIAVPVQSDARLVLLATHAPGSVLPVPGFALDLMASASTQLGSTADSAPVLTVSDRAAARPAIITAPLGVSSDLPAMPPDEAHTRAPIVVEASRILAARAHRTQRPVARPVRLEADNANPAPDRVPNLTHAPARAPTADLAAVRPAALLEAIAPDGRYSLNVLAIVQNGTTRQALVRTGPSQTALIFPGANLFSWRVVEVRRDGVVLTREGHQGFLPFDL